MRRDRYVRPRRSLPGAPLRASDVADRDPVKWRNHRSASAPSKERFHGRCLWQRRLLWLRAPCVDRATDVPLSYISDELPGQFDVPAFVSQGPFRKPVFPLRSKVPVHARADRF